MSINERIYVHSWESIICISSQEVETRDIYCITLLVHVIDLLTFSVRNKISNIRNKKKKFFPSNQQNQYLGQFCNMKYISNGTLKRNTLNFNFVYYTLNYNSY